MKVGRIIGLLILLLCVGGVSWHFWKKAEPRRDSLQALRQFNDALASGNAAKILELVSLPSALIGRTAAEQSEFLSKALRDEISTEGLGVLQREGQYGSLTNIFPAEAAAWAKTANVPVQDCVAFKLERNGLRAEVVLAYNSPLHTPQSKLRIVRCNNVKQLAMQ